MEKYNFLIDTHTHIDGTEFDVDRDDVINRARKQNIKYIVNVGGTNILEGSEHSVNLAKKYPFIFAVVGQHPQDADTKLDEEKLKRLIKSPHTIAIGETGLDFYKDWSDFNNQENLFRKHIELAHEFKKPLVIHCRNAGKRCVEILQEMEAQKIGGVFHCYSESIEIFNKIQNMNFIVSFTGVITFKNAHKVRDVVKQIPLEKIMIETDAPYMTPEPFRGTRCEPSYVLYTAKKLAEIKGCSFEKVMDITTKNFFNLFGNHLPLLKEN